MTGTLTQVVSGAGTLTKDGPGTIVLANNNNSWAGGTIIAAGTLQLGTGGVSGSLPSGSAVTNNGMLLLNRNSAFTLGNAISGSGGLSQIAPAGIVTLTGNNSYAGPTTVTAGTLYVNGAQTGKGLPRSPAAPRWAARASWAAMSRSSPAARWLRAGWRGGGHVDDRR